MNKTILFYNSREYALAEKVESSGKTYVAGFENNTGKFTRMVPALSGYHTMGEVQAISVLSESISSPVVDLYYGGKRTSVSGLSQSEVAVLLKGIVPKEIKVKGMFLPCFYRFIGEDDRNDALQRIYLFRSHAEEVLGKLLEGR